MKSEYVTFRSSETFTKGSLIPISIKKWAAITYVIDLIEVFFLNQKFGIEFFNSVNVMTNCPPFNVFFTPTKIQILLQYTIWLDIFPQFATEIVRCVILANSFSQCFFRFCHCWFCYFYRKKKVLFSCKVRDVFAQ